MSKYTINYKENSNADTYLKIILGILLFSGIVFSVFVFLVSNSALAKKNSTAKIVNQLEEVNEYVGDLTFMNVYEGKELYYIVRDFKYYYVYNEDLTEVFNVRYEEVMSIEKIDGVFINSYNCISIGYIEEDNALVYEIKTVHENSIGYYYYNALNAEFLRFYVLGGEVNE